MARFKKFIHAAEIIFVPCKSENEITLNAVEHYFGHIGIDGEIKNLAKQLENAKFYLTVLIIKLLPAIFLNEDSGLFVDSRKNYYPITF